MKFYIYIENRMVAEIEGYEFAWEVYRKTCELADMIGETANLAPGETGEVLPSSHEYDDDCSGGHPYLDPSRRHKSNNEP